MERCVLLTSSFSQKQNGLLGSGAVAHREWDRYRAKTECEIQSMTTHRAQPSLGISTVIHEKIGRERQTYRVPFINQTSASTEMQPTESAKEELVRL